MPFHEFTSVHGNRSRPQGVPPWGRERLTRNARPYLSNGVLRNHAGINSQRRRGADSQSAASRLIGTRLGACPASVPMSRDAAGTSACATGPVAKCEVIFAWSLSIGLCLSVFIRGQFFSCHRALRGRRLIGLHRSEEHT